MLNVCRTHGDHNNQRPSGTRIALVSAGLMLGTAILLAGVKAGVMYWGEGSMEGYWDALLDKIWVPVMMVGTIPSVSASGSCGSCWLSRLFRGKPRRAEAESVFPHA